MTNLVRIMVLATLLIVATAALFPLRLAGLERVGVTARAAEGTLWQGRLSAAQLRGVPIGDMDVQLSAASLLTGQLQIAFAGDGLGGTITKSTNALGVNALNGRTGPVQISGLPVTAIEFDNVDVSFSERSCAAASGQVRVRLTEGLTPAADLTGSPGCDGASIKLPLASDSGQVRLDLQTDSAGHYKATLTINGVNEAQLPAMLVSGFRQTPTGLVMIKEGTF